MTRSFGEILRNAENACSSNDLSDLQMAVKMTGFLAQELAHLEEKVLRLERDNAAQLEKRSEAADV